MTISSLVFPSFLSNPAYENKKVTFKALKPSEFDISDSNVVVKSIKDTIDYVLPGGGEKALDFAKNMADETIGIPDGFNLDSSVTLPYPISLSDNQNHNWENTEGLVAQLSNNFLSAFIAYAFELPVVSLIAVTRYFIPPYSKNSSTKTSI